MAAGKDMSEYQYSLQGLDLSQAQAAQDLLTVLKQESDTFELAEARDSLAQQTQSEALVTNAAQPQKTWLLWANAKNGKQLQVGIASIADGEVGIAILSEHQGQGLGRLTMEALINWAKKLVMTAFGWMLTKRIQLLDTYTGLWALPRLVRIRCRFYCNPVVKQT